VTGLPDADAKPVPTQLIGVSDPRPTVVLDPVDRSQIIIGETNATVSLHGYVLDPIADNIPRGGGADIQNVKVYVDGEYVEGGDPQVYAFDDNAPSFWRQHPYQGEFGGPQNPVNVSIDLEEGTHIIRVECSGNAAGNTGFDEVAVTLEKRVIPGSVAGGGTTVVVNIAFYADSSIDTKDTIRYYYGDDDVNAVTLKEAFPVLRWGTQGSGPGQFDHPMSVAVLSDAVFVLDNGNARVQKFTKTGSFCSSVSIESTGSFCGICASGGFIYAADDGTYVPPPGTSVPGAFFSATFADRHECLRRNEIGEEET